MNISTISIRDASSEFSTVVLLGARDGEVNWGTVLQAGRSQVRLPMVLLEFFIDTVFLAALKPWGRLSH